MTLDDAKDEVAFWTAEVRLLQKEQAGRQGSVDEIEDELANAKFCLLEAIHAFEDARCSSVG